MKRSQILRPQPTVGQPQATVEASKQHISRNLEPQPAGLKPQPAVWPYNSPYSFSFQILDSLSPHFHSCPNYSKITARIPSRIGKNYYFKHHHHDLFFHIYEIQSTKRRYPFLFYLHPHHPSSSSIEEKPRNQA